MNHRILALVVSSIFVTLVSTANPALSDQVITQSPCTSAQGYCLEFSSVAPVPDIRKIAFSAPSAGTAIASFHGSLYCQNGYYEDKVIDIITQIVTGKKAPKLDGPGGMRLATVLKDTGEHILPTSSTFNLSSNRVINISKAGRQIYRFKIGVLRLDSLVTCYVYNATFTVEFVK